MLRCSSQRVLSVDPAIDGWTRIDFGCGDSGANSTRRYGFHIAIILAALIAMAAVAISILLCYGLADQLARVIGKTGMIVIVRLSSFLLVCIGVQIMWNGLSALLSTLHA